MEERNYEPETVRIFNEVLKDGDQVIIAGAHQGGFAYHCSKLVGEKGKVLAFEPEPENNKILSKTVEGLNNVEVFPFALGDRNLEEVAFYINSDNDGGHALWDVSQHPFNVKTKQDKQVIKVKIKTIDDLFADRDMSSLKLLMLDAEGSEHCILKGAINTIVDNDVPYVICEIGNEVAMTGCQTSEMALRNYMSVYGFSEYLMLPDKVKKINKSPIVKKDSNDKGYTFNMFFSRRGEV